MSKARELADAIGERETAGGLVSGRKNLIINGAMQVAQRGTSVTGITTNPGYVTVDRFSLDTVIGTLTAEQSTDAPDGFSNSFKVSCTTAEATGSLGSGDYIQINHKIEGQNLQQLGFGTANAKPMTLSFWVKSNKTGTATVELQQKDNSDRQVTPSYTINSADTWEYKTISIPADTSGVINNDNGVGMWVLFWLQSGSAFTGGTNQTSWTTESNPDRNASNLEFATSTSDYFAITGVQLEVGSVATPFEHRSFGEELSLCQRYYYMYTQGNTKLVNIGLYYTSTQINTTLNFPTSMRTNPTLDHSTGTNYYRIYRSGASDTFDSFLFTTAEKNAVQLYQGSGVSGTAGQAGIIQTNNASVYIAFDAEL